MSIRLDHQSHPIIPTINLARAGGNPSLCPGASLVNFGTIEQLNCLFRYKLRARKGSSKQKMQSLSSLLTGTTSIVHRAQLPATSHRAVLVQAGGGEERERGRGVRRKGKMLG